MNKCIRCQRGKEETLVDEQYCTACVIEMSEQVMAEMRSFIDRLEGQTDANGSS